MNLTEALRKYARDHLAVAADASDDVYKRAVAKALEDGKLSPKQLQELTVTSTEGENRLRTLVRDELRGLDIGGQIAIAISSLNLGKQTSTTNNTNTNTGTNTGTGSTTDQNGGQNTGGAGGTGNNTGDMASVVRREVEAALKSAGQIQTEASPHYLLSRSKRASDGVDAHSIRVRKATERYDATRSPAQYHSKYPVPEMRGQQMTHVNRSLYIPSQADKAVIGAYAKWMYGVSLRNPGFKMSDHENDLMEYALKELPWVGYVDGDGDGNRETFLDSRKMTDLEQKALLNDAVSGGVNAVPVVYDDAAILAPIQTGELYPLVQTIPVARGRIIRAFSVGTPVLSSGIPEGTAIPLFDTTGFIAALDTTIYPVVGAIEIGLDFEEDSPANFGQLVIDRYGEKHGEWLDEQIANGDGTTEPLGIFNTGALSIVPSVSGVAGPLTLADLEALIFGVDRMYRRARGGRMAFVMNDVNYRRFRALATATGWNTRLFGTNYEDYSLLGYPVRIIPTISNNKMAFVNLSFYRMYRRQGLQVKVTTEGQDLTRRNMRLIVVRALWGGRLFEAGAGAVMIDAPN